MEWIADAAAIDSNGKFIYANAQSGAIALLAASESIYIYIQNNIVLFATWYSIADGIMLISL